MSKLKKYSIDYLQNLKLGNYFSFKELIEGTPARAAISPAYWSMLWNELEDYHVERLIEIVYPKILLPARLETRKAVYVHCTFRPVKYELLKDRSGNSQHTNALAADYSTEDLGDMLLIRRKKEKTHNGGFHLYFANGKPNFIHEDERGYKARW